MADVWLIVVTIGGVKIKLLIKSLKSHQTSPLIVTYLLLLDGFWSILQYFCSVWSYGRIGGMMGWREREGHEPQNGREMARKWRRKTR